MTIDTTTPPAPPRSARPKRTRRTPARWRNRRRLLIPRRRVGRVRVPLADAALHLLMQEADIYKIGRNHYLVALVWPELLDTLIVAAAATEDDEENFEGDGLELAIGDTLISGESDGDCDDEEDNEDLGIDDEPHDEPWQDMEPSLGWSDGPQFRLDAGYINGAIREGDDNSDDEPDHEGEDSDPGGSNPLLGPGDIDAQRGRIASRWPVRSGGAS